MPIRKLFLICELALVLVLGYVVVSTLLNPAQTVEIFTPGSVSGMQSDSGAVDMNMSPPPPVCSAIVDKNIFTGGESSNLQKDLSSQTQPVVFKSAEEELGLELIGIIAGNQAISRAIIKNTKNRTLDSYRVGQNVAGARLDAIEQDRVILFHKGEPKMLKLKSAGRVDITETAPPAAVSRQRTTDAPAPEPKIEQSKDDSEGSSMADRLGRLLREAKIEPYTVNGEVDGLQISGLENVPGAQNIGLKNGDIIRTVNGHKLNSKQRAFQVFMKAKTQSTMNVEILRDNKKRKVSFSLK